MAENTVSDKSFIKGGAKGLLKSFEQINTGIKSMQKTWLEFIKVVKGNPLGSGPDIPKYKKAQSEAAKLSRKIATEEKKRTKVAKVLQKELTKQRLETQKTNKQIKLAIQLRRSEKGSIDRLNTVNALLRDRLRKVNQETERGRQIAARMISVIDRNSAKVTKLSDAYTRQKRTIGAYGTALKGVRAGFTAMALKVTAAIAVFRTLGRAFSNSLKNLDQQARAEKSLEVAIGGVSTALQNQASSLQGRTRFGDEAIIQGQAFLAQQRLTRDQIMQLTPAILDFAQATGMDVSQAFQLVAKSVGSSTNALARYGIEIKGTAKSAERTESTVKALNDAFGGQAEAAAKVGIGALQQLQNTMGDTSENFGEFLSFFVQEFIPQFQKNMDLMNAKSDIVFEDMENDVLSAGEALQWFAGLDPTKSRELEARVSARKTATAFVEEWIAQGRKIEDIGAMNVKTFVDKINAEVGQRELKKLKTPIGEWMNETFLGPVLTAELEKANLDVILEKQAAFSKEFVIQIERIKGEAKDFKPIIVPDNGTPKNIKKTTDALEVQRIELIRYAQTEKMVIDIGKEFNKAYSETIDRIKSGARELEGVENLGFGDVGEADFGFFLEIVRRFQKVFSNDVVSEIISGGQQVANAVKGALLKVNDARKEALQEEISIRNQSILELQNELIRREQSISQGNAAEIGEIEDRLQREKDLRDQALRDKARAVQRQKGIDAIEQGSALVTAIANLFKDGIKKAGIAGIAAAIAASVTLAGSFAALSQSANSEVGLATGGTIKEGTVTASGDRHNPDGSGGIPLSNYVNVEDKEMVGVLNRAATRRSGKDYEALTHWYNSGNTGLPELMMKGRNIDTAVQNIVVHAEFKEMLREQKETNRNLEKYNYLLMNQEKITQLPDGTILKNSSTGTIVIPPQS